MARVRCARALTQAGLAEYTWLAVSSGWAGSRTFAAWNTKQGAALPSPSFDHDSDEAKDYYGGSRSPDEVRAAEEKRRDKYCVG